MAVSKTVVPIISILAKPVSVVSVDKLEAGIGVSVSGRVLKGLPSAYARVTVSFNPPSPIEPTIYLYRKGADKPVASKKGKRVVFALRTESEKSTYIVATVPRRPGDAPRIPGLEDSFAYSNWIATATISGTLNIQGLLSRLSRDLYNSVYRYVHDGIVNWAKQADLYRYIGGLVESFATAAAQYIAEEVRNRAISYVRDDLRKKVKPVAIVYFGDRINPPRINVNEWWKSYWAHLWDLLQSMFWNKFYDELWKALQAHFWEIVVAAATQNWAGVIAVIAKSAADAAQHALNETLDKWGDRIVADMNNLIRQFARREGAIAVIGDRGSAKLAFPVLNNMKYSVKMALASYPLMSRYTVTITAYNGEDKASKQVVYDFNEWRAPIISMTVDLDEFKIR